ncbi:MAG: hypothetical protein IKY83_08010 [Proteobacteria bacterium]|nr:hypothetical protein [Pseudomonadota bacterium]
MFHKFWPIFIFLTGCASASLPATNVPETPVEALDHEADSMIIPEHAQRTPSGYAYMTLHPGGEKPLPTDAVRVHLKVLTVEGTVVDENDATLAVSHSTPFFEEFLPQMAIGEKIRVWGDQARIWEIEMLSVDAHFRAPEDVSAPPADALSLPEAAGVRYRVLDAGHGEKPKPGQALRVQATRWKDTGEILESNRDSRGMVIFLTEEATQVDPVHDAVLRELNEGAHARLWIPAEMLGAGFGITEDLWLVEYLHGLDVPTELAAPADAQIVEPDAAWMRFETRTGAENLKENDAVAVEMTCWNGATGALVDSSIVRDKHDIMEIKPALGVWQKIMMAAAPGDIFMTWIKTSALPEQVNMDLVCRVKVFEKV